MQEVVWRLSADCPYQRARWDRPPRKYQVRCNARIVDLDDTENHPPDVASEDRRAQLRAINGGKRESLNENSRAGG